MKLPWRSFLPFLSLCVLSSGAAAAQERFQERLPENTLFYVVSSGRPGLDGVRGTNPLLRLLASPEMKANWESMRAMQSRRSKPNEKEQPVSKDDEDFLELLRAPGLVALLPPDPEAAPRAAGGPQPVFLFLVDTTAQEERIERLRARAEGQGVAYSSYDFEGVTVEEARNNKGEPTGYLARLDRWLVGGSEKASSENWIRAVRQAPPRSLKDAEVYSLARARLSSAGQLEGYINLPAAVELLAAVPTLGPNAPPPEQIVAALGLRALGPLLWTLDFQAETTAFQIALGRHQAGASPFDVLAPATPRFASLSLGGSDALGYSVTRVDLQAGWGYLRGAAATLFPPAALFEEMADSFLHEQTDFTLPQIISVWGDELAHFEYASQGALPLETVWALRHRDHTRVLALIEGALPALAERMGSRQLARVGVQDGIAAYYKLEPKHEASEEADTEAAVPAVCLAVTDEWLFFSTSESALKRTLARAADSPTLEASEAYRRARSRFPAELSTFGFMNVDAWLASGVVQRFLEQAAAAQQARSADDNKAGEAPAEAPALPKLAIPRGYLRWIVTGTTQDARGVYHSGYIE